MTVYVDEIRDYPTGKWCHLWSDNDSNELHEFAKKLGMKRAWVHISRGEIGLFVHYDLRPSKRELALQSGAVFMPLREWIERQKAR